MVRRQAGGAADPNVGPIQPLTDPGPFKTNDQRRVESAERQERFEKRIAAKSNVNTGTGSDKPQISRGAPTRPQDNPFVNLQIYNPIKPPMAPRPTEAVVPNPYQIPVLGFDPRNYMGMPYGAPMTMPLAYQPLQNYTIDINGINASYSKLNRVMQDQLPDRDTLDTMTTISERKRLLDFIRTVFIKVSDGEMSSLGDSNDAMSLLSRLKFVDLNPYHYDPVNRNPLRSLPYGYLVYRTAYPLRYDPSNISVRAAQDSTGINVRLYRLSVDSLRARHIQYDATSNSRKRFDVWRELDWYEDVRQNVIAAGRSPHLTMMYCWMIAPCTIDWDALRRAGNALNITTGQLDTAVTRALKPLVPVATQAIVVDAAGRVGARQVLTAAPMSRQQPNSNAPLPTEPLGSVAMTLGVQTLGIGTPPPLLGPAVGNVTSVQNLPANGVLRTINGVRTTGQMINGIWTPGQVINGQWTQGQVIAGVWTPGQFVNGVWTHADGPAVQPTNVGTAYTTALGLQNRTSITDQFGQTLLMPNNITNAPLVQTVHGGALAVIRPAPQDSGYCAIAMTDASTHNMVAWSSIAYDLEFHF
jgi:hypothetical protein